MDRQFGLMSCAAAAYALSLVEFAPAFIAPSATVMQRAASASLNLRGNGAAAEGPGSASAFRSTLQAASTVLALAACGAAARDRRSAKGRQSAVTACRAKVDGEVTSPTIVYTEALTAAAEKKGESVQVTKDIMKVKKLLADDGFQLDLQFVVNDLMISDLEKADRMCKSFGTLESTVFPKFVTYLAKKKRVLDLWPICSMYVENLYETQDVYPVRVKSAQALTDAQKNDIKAKMAEKTGAGDIKLVCEVDGDLMAGFQLEWGFIDPDTLTTPSEGLDFSLRRVIGKSAVKAGVPSAAE